MLGDVPALTAKPASAARIRMCVLWKNIVIDLVELL